ncbi:MAG: putative selenate reductase subunit YgfK [Deltaproteobacteria bacterium]|nr:putative selenate reductase subunit YgfK [Deltaproteobacteria bacterium]
MNADKFTPCNINRLFDFVFSEKNGEEIFGIPRELFFTPKSEDPFKIKRYGQILETPVGVAAGPHTQMSQNIISAWLVGARYMELKTVQILDELEVTKPCIDMTDEGYNCEWSQELKLRQSLDQYIDAWIILHILKEKFGFKGKDSGFIFNASVGYNLEGIKSPQVTSFLDKITNASSAIKEKTALLEKKYPEIKNISIPSSLTDNVTISTMHGCPPDEIEKIAEYFIKERKFHTTVKLNPTLLGPEKVREILNKKLGYNIIVPNQAFEHDLKYQDGVAIIKSLIKKAEKAQVKFSLKLTNTLETLNIKKNLPEKEKMHYMSGRALHPISVNLAAVLQKEFNGNLDISFAAGVDSYNIVEVLKCGLAPITVSSDILKPGGYGRIKQYVESIQKDFDKCSAKDLEEYIIKNSEKTNIKEAALENLQKYAEKVINDNHYKKSNFPYSSVKTDKKLKYFDCAQATCATECPANQKVSRYINYISEGKIEKAYLTILADNPLPNVQGKVCNRLCAEKCARINYDKPLMIRELKRFAAENSERTELTPAALNGLKAAIIGGGPSGLSCAHYLALNGFEVSIYEGKSFLGGMAADGIPLFRLDKKSLDKDINAILALGVKAYTNKKIDAEQFNALKNNNDYVYIAAGAQKSAPLNISGIQAKGVFDQLTFLSAVKQNRKIDTGKKIIIIGGGNSAIDAARTAKRLSPDNEVTILYRRTKEQMPCGIEEINEALDEKIELIELVSPEAIQVKKEQAAGITVSKMELKEPDTSGRPKPVKIENSEFTIKADTIIVAIGQKTDINFYPDKKLTVNPNTLMTSIENIFAGGDVIRGASTLINAIADGKKAAFEIIRKAGEKIKIDITPIDERKPDYKKLKMAKMRRSFGLDLPEIKPEKRMNFNLFVKTLNKEQAQAEASRCLACDIFCGVCVTVCPNRSNVWYKIKPFALPCEKIQNINGKTKITTVKTVNIKQDYQILNIGDFCNECGNCTVFCPTSGAPYKDKPKFHLTSESFEEADFGFYFEGKNIMKIKKEGKISSLTKKDNRFIYKDDKISASLNAETLKAEKVDLKTDKTEAEIGYIAEYAFLYKNVKGVLSF